MQDNTLVIVALCGGAIVFFLLGAVVVHYITHSLRHFFVAGLIRRLIGGVDDNMKDDEAIGTYIAPRAHRDLRAEAQALDFDSAVARHRGQPVLPTQPVEAQAQPLQPSEPPPTSLNSRPLRGRPGKKREGDDHLDEVFGGMLDDDGDGDVDF